MRNILTVAWHEFSVNVTRPGFILWTLGLPLFGFVMLGVISVVGGGAALEAVGNLVDSSEEQAEVIGVIDEAGLATPLLPDFEEDYRLYESREAAEADLLDEALVAVVVIPPDYTTSGTLTILQPTAETAFAEVAFIGTGDVRPFLVAHTLREVDSGLQARAVDPVTDIERVEIGEADGSPVEQAAGFGLGFVFSILLVTTIFSSSGYLLRGVANEKDSRIIEILISSVSATELLAGKVLGLGGVGFVQIFIWSGSGVILASLASVAIGLSTGQLLGVLSSIGTLLLLLVYYVLGFGLYAVAMAAVGALGSNAEESQQMGGIFTVMASVPLMFFWILLSNPESIMLRVLSYFPFTAPTMMILRLPTQDVPPLEIVLSAGSLLITIPLVLWAGAKIFRMGMLMAGQKPSLGRIWQTLRES